MALDYTLFYKDSWSTVTALGNEHWDVFFSGYNRTERVRAVFDGINADTKRWLVHREYEFAADELPQEGQPFVMAGEPRESEFLQAFFNTLPELIGKRVCIDITGLMRPHIILLLRLLPRLGVRNFDAIYAEPAQYVLGEDTRFTSGDPSEVRPIEGFAGTHDPVVDADARRDLLIIGVGYEYELVRQVAHVRRNARQLQLIGFPPLRPDFYQQNRLNAQRASEWIGKDSQQIFAPANDPFVTAGMLQQTIETERRTRSIGGVYLAPLASRPQALGFGLYCVYDAKETDPVTILYPFTPKYARATSDGLTRVWKYQIELP
jgi:hypothetical protein